MYRQFGPQGRALADKYSTDDKPFNFRSIGASYDPGKWFLISELGQVNAHSAYGKREAWYVSGGYRLGQFTPYISWPRENAKSNRSAPGLPGAVSLNAALNEFLNDALVQKTVSIGTRWDFAKNAAIKLQCDFTDVGHGPFGTLAYRQPGFMPGGKFNVISVVLDFVF